jgi:hypothetical protein
MLVRKHEGKRISERPRCRWENDIQMVLEKRVSVCGADLVVRDRVQWLALVNRAIDLPGSLEARDFLTG